MSLKTFNDVIVAISTSPGKSGLTVVRLSGEDVIQVVSPFLSLKIFEPNTIKFSVFKNKEVVIDEVLISFFKAPKSFTGENMIEINCHGSYVIAKEILNLLYKNGARSAEPGEFTMRALINGKIDLAQAESIIDLIEAKTTVAAEVATSHLRGKLSEKIDELRKDLLDLVSHIEVHLDYPEEEELLEDFKYLSVLDSIINSIDGLLSSFSKGKIYKDGLVVAIVGKPNAGKSSLFNRWLQEDRAIVSDIPGTTRDTIEEWIELEGIPIKLVDTAGMRSSKDEIENLGIERTREYLKNADLVFAMFDAETGIDVSDKMLLEIIEPQKTIFLVNKMDKSTGDTISEYILDKYVNADIFRLSVLQDHYLSQLKLRLLKKVESFLQTGNCDNEVILNNQRQQECLIKAKEAVSKARLSLQEQNPEDFWVIDLKEALGYLGQILGKDISDEILDNIFSRFCIGK